jgi:predicted metal-dependent peptidase
MNEKMNDENQDISKEPIPKLPVPKDFTGKLPKEFVDEIIKDAEEFAKKWEAAKEYELQPHLMSLGFDEPFFGSLSKRIEKIRTASIPTAGVSIVDSTLEMYWNPIFFKFTLKDGSDVPVISQREAKEKHAEIVKGIMKHELYHIIFEHITTRRQEPHALWNAATDCAINSLIPRRELPDFGLIPGEMYKPENPPPNWKPGIIARLVKAAPKGLSSEQYMQLFLSDPEVQEAIDKARQRADAKIAQRRAENGSDPGDQGSDPGNNPSQDDGGEFEQALRDELYGDGGGQFDDHEVWDKISDEQRDMLRDYVRDILRGSIREAEQRANGWGNIPASVQEHLKKIVSREIDWRELINEYIGKSRCSKTTSSLKRMNRRQPWDFPGRRRAYKARPAFALDQSGSMSDEHVALLFAEVSNLGNVTEYDIIPFDHTVDEKNIQTCRRNQQPVINRTRCGGTDFSAPVRYVNEHIDKYDVMFIATDGECCEPEKCDIPIVYIIAPGHKLMFKTNHPVIQMTEKKK